MRCPDCRTPALSGQRRPKLRCDRIASDQANGGINIYIYIGLSQRFFSTMHGRKPLEVAPRGAQNRAEVDHLASCRCPDRAGYTTALAHPARLKYMYIGIESGSSVGCGSRMERTCATTYSWARSTDVAASRQPGDLVITFLLPAAWADTRLTSVQHLRCPSRGRAVQAGRRAGGPPERRRGTGRAAGQPPPGGGSCRGRLAEG